MTTNIRPHSYDGDPDLLDLPMLEGKTTYGQWLRIVEEAEDIRFLVVKAGGMVRKSSLDAWLVERYPWLTIPDAHGIANEVEARNRTIYRRLGDQLQWAMSRSEPTYEQYGVDGTALDSRWSH